MRDYPVHMLHSYFTDFPPHLVGKLDDSIEPAALNCYNRYKNGVLLLEAISAGERSDKCARVPSLIYISGN
jgi:hypothetical protein